MSAGDVLPDEVETIGGAIAFWADLTPDAPALIAADAPPVSYAELRDRVSELAEMLGRHGVTRLDRVAIVLPDGPAYAVALLGAMCAAIAVPLGDDLPTAELRSALGGVRVSIAIVSRRISDDRVFSLRAAGAALVHLDADGRIGALPMPPGTAAVPFDRLPGPADLAVISQTSGTTDRPKRVPRTHGWIVRSGRRHRKAYQLGPGDRVVAVSPFALSLGHWTIFHVMAAGGALVFPRSWELPAIWEAAVRHGATWFQVSAGWLELAAQFLREQPDLPVPPSLRFVRVTSAATTQALCDELAARLGAPILPCYASSEVGQVAAVFPPPAPARAGSVGQLVQEVRIVDDAEQDVAIGDAGEIWVRRAGDFHGYWDDPALNAEALTDDGWFRTGDVGYVGNDGFLFLTGRIKELINRGGAKIAPGAVDAVLAAHPAVGEAAAFAVPDDRFGEDIVAAVVLRPGQMATPRELRGWMLGRLAPHSVPRRIWFVPSLPRTASGKVQRVSLRDRYLAVHPIALSPDAVETVSE